MAQIAEERRRRCCARVLEACFFAAANTVAMGAMVVVDSSGDEGAGDDEVNDETFERNARADALGVVGLGGGGDWRFGKFARLPTRRCQA